MAEKGTYQVKIKQEIYVNVTAESGAQAKRIIESLKPTLSSPLDPALGNGDYTSRSYPIIIRAVDRKCDVCGYWQQSVGKGNCWTCRHEEANRLHKERQQAYLLDQSERGDE